MHLQTHLFSHSLRDSKASMLGSDIWCEKHIHIGVEDKGAKRDSLGGQPNETIFSENLPTCTISTPSCLQRYLLVKHDFIIFFLLFPARFTYLFLPTDFFLLQKKKKEVKTNHDEIMFFKLKISKSNLF